MTRTAFTVTTSSPTGTVLPASVAVDQPNGNSFANNGKRLIEITNGAASNINVTITTNGVYAAGGVNYAIADVVTTVVNATSQIFGPFDTTLFNDGSGNVLVDYSSGTSVTARVISTT